MRKAEIKPVVKLDIRPGPVTPAQQAAARKFWTKVIAEAKRESQAKATPTPGGGDDD